MFVFCWQSFAKLESTTSWGWQHWHLLLALKDKPQTRPAVLWTGTNPDMARHGMLPPWARYVVSSTNNAHASFGRVGVLALGVWEWEGSIIINGFHGNCFATSFFCKYEPDKYTDAHKQIRTKKKRCRGPDYPLGIPPPHPSPSHSVWAPRHVRQHLLLLHQSLS